VNFTSFSTHFQTRAQGTPQEIFDLKSMQQPSTFDSTLDLSDFLGSDIALRITIIDLSPDSHDDAIFSAPLENLKKEFDKVDIGLEKAQTREKEHYHKLRFHVYASPKRGHEMELVEGGDTDWTQNLLNNAKERLIISGIGSERRCEKFVPIRQCACV